MAVTEMTASKNVESCHSLVIEETNRYVGPEPAGLRQHRKLVNC